MPTWVYLYLALITFGAIHSMITFRSIWWFFLGESCALSFAFLFFLYYFDIFILPFSFLYYLLMAAFLLYWEWWVYHNYSFLTLPYRRADKFKLLILALVSVMPLSVIIVLSVYRYFEANY